MHLKNNQGFTLVEVIVSVTILAMGTLLFLVIINGSSAIFNRSTDLKQSGIQSSEALEIFENVNPEKPDGTVEFGDGNGSTLSVKGKYVSVTVEDVTFTLFVPNEPAEKK